MTAQQDVPRVLGTSLAGMTTAAEAPNPSARSR